MFIREHNKEEISSLNNRLTSHASYLVPKGLNKNTCLLYHIGKWQPLDARSLNFWPEERMDLAYTWFLLENFHSHEKVLLVNIDLFEILGFKESDYKYLLQDLKKHLKEQHAKDTEIIMAYSMITHETEGNGNGIFDKIPPKSVSSFLLFSDPGIKTEIFKGGQVKDTTLR